MSSKSEKLDQTQAQLLMSQLIDGELSPANAEKLNSYLEANPGEIDWMESMSLAGDSSKTQNGPVDQSVAISSIQTIIDKEAATENKVIQFPNAFRPLAAAAAIAIIGIFAWMGMNPTTSTAAPTPSIVEFVATDIPDASTFVISDDESGWTVVWVEKMDPLPEEHG